MYIVILLIVHNLGLGAQVGNQIGPIQVVSIYYY